MRKTIEKRLANMAMAESTGSIKMRMVKSEGSIIGCLVVFSTKARRRAEMMEIKKSAMTFIEKYPQLWAWVMARRNGPIDRDKDHQHHCYQSHIHGEYPVLFH